MLEISQEEIDNFRELTTSINKAQVMKVTNTIFDEAINNLKKRDSATQTIVGNLLTTIHIDLLKELKKLKTIVNK